LIGCAARGSATHDLRDASPLDDDESTE
jgi:hypothetical protein